MTQSLHAHHHPEVKKDIGSCLQEAKAGFILMWRHAHPNFPPSRSYSGRIILMRHRIQGQSDWEVPRNRHREDCTSWCEPGRKDKARHYRRHGVQVTHSCVHGRWGHVSEIDIFLRQHQAIANQLYMFNVDVVFPGAYSCVLQEIACVCLGEM